MKIQGRRKEKLTSSISTPLACKLAMNFCRHKLNLCFFFNLERKSFSMLEKFLHRKTTTKWLTLQLLFKRCFTFLLVCKFFEPGRVHENTMKHVYILSFIIVLNVHLVHRFYGPDEKSLSRFKGNK